jgi:hypothetical protein
LKIIKIDAGEIEYSNQKKGQLVKPRIKNLIITQAFSAKIAQ